MIPSPVANGVSRPGAVVAPFGWDVGTPSELAFDPLIDQLSDVFVGAEIDARIAPLVTPGEGRRVAETVRSEEPDMLVCIALGFFDLSDLLAAIHDRPSHTARRLGSPAVQSERPPLEHRRIHGRTNRKGEPRGNWDSIYLPMESDR